MRTIERSEGRERSEQSGAIERVSGASERANGRASGPVLMSLFLFVPDHSGLSARRRIRFPLSAVSMVKCNSHDVKLYLSSDKNKIE